jgi:hypothetical protein
MSDAYTSTLILACGIEVKEAGGDYNEALVQLGVWSAAALEKTRSLMKLDQSSDLKPYIGITVIGHEWKVHISWKAPETGETVGAVLYRSWN